MRNIFSCFLFVCCCAFAVSAQDLHFRVINVTGEAEVLVPPDHVSIDLAVETSAKTLAAAKAQHDQRVRALLEVTKTMGIEPKDVQTSRVNMRPDYEDSKFIGYKVTQGLRVVLRDISKYEPFVTRVLEAGVNRIDDVEFEIADTRKHRDQARLLALRAATEKASAMASEMGAKLGKARRIDENGIGPLLSLNAGIANTTSTFGSLSDSGTTLATGQIVIRARVSVTFDLE